MPVAGANLEESAMLRPEPARVQATGNPRKSRIAIVLETQRVSEWQKVFLHSVLAEPAIELVAIIGVDPNNDLLKAGSSFPMAAWALVNRIDKVLTKLIYSRSRKGTQISNPNEVSDVLDRLETSTTFAYHRGAASR